MKPFFKRAGFGFYLLASTVILLEVGLHLLSFMVGEDRGGVIEASELRVVTLGDSNTYGLYVEADQAWPSRLKSFLVADLEVSADVINLGYPGTNSSRVKTQYYEVLKAFDPDVVLVMIGVNDFWNEPIFDEDNLPHHEKVKNFLRRYSRIYKWYRIYTRSKFVQEDLYIDDKSVKLDLSNVPESIRNEIDLDDKRFIAVGRMPEQEHEDLLSKIDEHKEFLKLGNGTVISYGSASFLMGNNLKAGGPFKF